MVFCFFRFRHLLKKHVLVGVLAVPWLFISIGYCTRVCGVGLV